MKEIFENLYESVSEACFEDIVSMVEAFINEVSVKRWKEAATNSIEGRKQKRKDNEDDYYEFSGKLSPSLQKDLDKGHQDRDDYHSDRVARAKYLANNLPDSKKPANKVLNAAKKVSDERSKKSDEQQEAKAKAVTKYLEGDKEYSGTEYDKLVRKFGNARVAHARDRHAQIIAGKHATGNDGKRAQGNYDEHDPNDLVSPSKRLQEVNNNVKKAKEEHGKARSASLKDKLFGVYDSEHEDNLKRTANNLIDAEHNKKLFTRDYK